SGEKRGAGTDANVFLTMRGSKGVSPKLQLKSDRRNTFERGQSDVFRVKSVNVGNLKRIRMEIDDTGFAPAWFLERVVVVDLANPSQRIYFPCGQWLSDDEQLFRDLVGSSNPLARPKMNAYVVHTFTGDVRGAGTDATVKITLFGDHGDSGQLVLDDSKNNFERARKDTFSLQCPHLGKIKKIRIGHDNGGVSPGWYLDKVVVDDTMMDCVYSFPCQRWFAKDEDDGRITRELVAGVGEAGIPYQVQVFTGDVRGAATDAEVYIILHGGKKGQISSGKIILDGKFQRNRVDICDIESTTMLSPLDHIEIGHDNSGTGPGWYLEKVVITCPTNGCEQVFSCRKWLATDEGDGLISRQLYESKSLRKQVVQKSAWNCLIWTSDVRNAGTDANVFIQVYGENGKSDELPLDNETDNFETGQKDKFKKGDLYTFKCGKWLDTNEGDGEVIREIPSTGPGVKRPQPLVRYSVSVVTGDKRGAGTDANVSCCLYGRQGDTGNRPLTASKNNRNKFERGQSDEFTIEAVDLKSVKKVKIGHDDSGVGDGWFLKEVIVRDEATGESTTFPCDRWLATDEDDGAIVRELTSEGSPQLLNTTSYHVAVKTGDIRGAGTDADVYIQIYGSDGDTGRLKLTRGENIRNKFERGRTDKFKLEATDIGRLERIYIGHSDSGIGAGWFLDGIEIDVPSSGMHYTFKANRWLASDEGDGKTEIELYPTQTRQQDKLLPYEITVATGDTLNAGTDAQVVLQLYGEDGKSEVMKLRNKTDNFERKAIDKFKRKKRRRGQFNQSEVETYWFVCKRWFDKSEDDGQIIRELVPTDEAGRPIDEALQELEYTVDVYTGDKYGAGTDSNVFLTLYGENGDSGERKLDKSVNINKFERNQVDSFKLKAADLSTLKKLKIRHDNSEIGSSWFVDRVEVKVKGETWVFPCQRWLSTKEDDGQIERTLVPVDATYQRLQQQKQGRKASIAVRDAIALETKAQLTTYETYRDKFERNHIDVFTVESADLGVLKKIKIGHDNAGLSPVPYEITVYTSEISGAGTDADVYVVLYGREGIATEQTSLCSSKDERKSRFNKKGIDTFVLELDDIGEVIEKLRIGHDGKGWGAGWHLDKVEVRRLLEGVKGSETSTFTCGRWLARDEDDGEIVRELVPTKIVKEQVTKSGKLKRSESKLDDALKNQQYKVHVFTGDVFRGGTDANVFITIFGENGDTGERKLLKSETNTDKFERGKVNKKFLFKIISPFSKPEDIFKLDAVDLGKLFKVHIRHDNALIQPAWFLDRVEIEDTDTGSIYVFHCERWLAKNKEDGKIARHHYISLKLTNARNPAIPYTVKIETGSEEGSSCKAPAFIKIFGPSKKGTVSRRWVMIPLEPYSGKFKRGTIETFNIEAIDVGSIKKIEIGHSSVDEEWFVESVMVNQPTLGKSYTFKCHKWFARSKDDGLVSRIFTTDDAEKLSFKAKIPYEIT
uniref:PLAT domain-containing protein n=1 Tax=Ciona savignyi TaxID=51511 RepID=H2ZAW6_CIOSA